MKHIKIDGVVYHYNEKTEEYISSGGNVAPKSFIVKSFAEGRVEKIEMVKLFVFGGGELRYELRDGEIYWHQDDGFVSPSILSKEGFLEKLSTEDFTVDEIYL